jgi:hypothetical protein
LLDGITEKIPERENNIQNNINNNNRINPGIFGSKNMINISLSKKNIHLDKKNQFNVNNIKTNSEANSNKDVEMKDGTK